MLKSYVLLSIACLPFTTQAGVLLEKVTHPGFVMPGYAITRSCVITDTDKLIIQYQLGDMTSKRTLPVKLSKNSINAMIADAAAGTINSEPFPVDANTVIYRAYQKQAAGVVKTVLLHEENGGVGEKKSNDSMAAVSLRNFMDVNCGDELLQ